MMTKRGRDCLQVTTNNNKRSSPRGSRSLILKHAGDHHKPVLINWSDLINSTVIPLVKGYVPANANKYYRATAAAADVTIC